MKALVKFNGGEKMKALIKFNGGEGALLCNNCMIIIAYGLKHEDKEHYCESCARELVNEHIRTGLQQ